MGLAAGMPPPVRPLPLTLFNIDTWDELVFGTFSDNLKATILKSPEAQARNGSGSAPPAAAAPQPVDDVPF